MYSRDYHSLEYIPSLSPPPPPPPPPGLRDMGFGNWFWLGYKESGKTERTIRDLCKVEKYNNLAENGRI